MTGKFVDRRSVLGAGVAAIGATAGGAGTRVHAATAPRVSAIAGRTHPKFLWGTAGAAYQIEGGNVASDAWVLEHVKPAVFKEPSNDAADVVHRYREDIALAASLGFNTHRFSIEWSCIEPERGQISYAALAYYRDVLETIRRHGMTPLVTLCHFTTPRWFAAGGGFSTPAGVAPFVAYCRLIADRLGDAFDMAATFNEPNLMAQLSWSPSYPGIRAVLDAVNRAAGVATGSPSWQAPMLGDWRTHQPVQIEAHNRACDALHAASKGRIKVGVTLALADERAPPTGPSGVATKQARIMQPWLDAAGDWIGVQNYTYSLVGPQADLPYPPGTQMTQMDYPVAPEALGNVVRAVASKTKLPIYITENGIATEDDRQRIAYIDAALTGVAGCLRDGIDVRGYIHWSLLDNWEWFFGYRPRFGLVAVDRQTFERTPKPSAVHLGRIARRRAAPR